MLQKQDSGLFVNIDIFFPAVTVALVEGFDVPDGPAALTHRLNNLL